MQRIVGRGCVGLPPGLTSSSSSLTATGRSACLSHQTMNRFRRVACRLLSSASLGLADPLNRILTTEREQRITNPTAPLRETAKREAGLDAATECDPNARW